MVIQHFTLYDHSTPTVSTRPYRSENLTPAAFKGDVTMSAAQQSALISNKVSHCGQLTREFLHFVQFLDALDIMSLCVSK